MKRRIYKKLVEWKQSTRRKPLMLYGARQVGKTFILKEFGRNEYDNLVYINCYKNSSAKRLFSADVDVKQLLLGLSALSGQQILQNKTLIFLDEVQEIPEAVASLKYFCENAPDIHIAVAGSLLGVMNMEGSSFPTGKVEVMHMYPMTFMEFLEAAGEGEKNRLLTNPEMTDSINAILPSYIDLLRQYYFVGGMPEAVAEFIAHKDLEAVRKIQQDILTAYESDIAKHAGSDTVKARMVFQSIPSQLARENKKYIFGAVKKGARASTFENAIQWLVDAGLVYRVPRVTKAKMPLKFYVENNAFKLFLLDVGLLGAMVQAPASTILIGNQIFSEYKGAFTENYAMTQMAAINGIVVGYYSKDNSSLEIDFIVQVGDKIVPVEVKAEENVKSKSLHQFVTIDNAHSGMHGIRFSMKGFARHDWITNIPLIAVEPYLIHTRQNRETESH